jgi:hypothetical protein
MISAVNGVSTVELTIPMRAEYVSIARLTAAGVANRLGFDIETIEAIKVSLSEVCNRIISIEGKYVGGLNEECKIKFVLSGNSLGIDFFIKNTELINNFLPDGISSQDRLGGSASGVVIDIDRLGNDHRSEESYEDQLQLSLITLLMDEFIVNPYKNCLVSMKKYLD